MRKTLGIFSIITLFAISAFAASKPNVVMIVLDDLNDYLGVMDGHPQAITPNLDRLASQGILFESAHSNAPVCAPSRASFMFGIYPSTSGNYGFVHWNENEVLINSKSLPVLMQENGYQTSQTGKVFHHNSSSEWMELGIKKYQGPVAYNGKDPVVHPSVPKPFADVGLLDGTFAPLSDIPTVPATTDAPGFTGWWHSGYGKEFKYVNDDNRDLMTDEESVEWFKNKLNNLESSASETPFFISVGIMNPHTPHVVPQKYFDLYPLESLKIPVISDNDIDDCHYGEVLGGKGPDHFEALKNSYSTLDEALRAYLQGYLACVSFSDEIVGNIIAAIDSSAFATNTIVMLFSDHGYNMGEKDYLFKNSLWEESTRVPFIIRHPGYAENAGKKVNQPIGLVDVYPTLKELCGLNGSTVKNAKGAELDGHSVVPFLADPDNGTWDGPNVALTVVKNPASDDAAMQNYSVRSKNYRYVWYSNGSEELYDHRYDSYEWVNEADNLEYDSIKRVLKQELKALIPDINFTVIDQLYWQGTTPWFFTESNWIDQMTQAEPAYGTVDPATPINRNLLINSYVNHVVGPVASDIDVGSGDLTIINTTLKMNPDNNVGIISQGKVLLDSAIIETYFLQGGWYELNNHSQIIARSNNPINNSTINFKSNDCEVILVNTPIDEAKNDLLNLFLVNDSTAVLNDNMNMESWNAGTRIYPINIVSSGQLKVTLDKKKVYPNPADQFIIVDDFKSTFNYAFYTINGTNVRSGTSKRVVDTSDLPSGAYYLTTNGNATHKVIIQH